MPAPTEPQQPQQPASSPSRPPGVSEEAWMKLTALSNQATTAPPPVYPTKLPQIPGYESLEELGRGNMGIVYKARQAGLNRLVAIKMVLRGNHNDATMLARFQREAEAVAQLRHQNIVQVYASGTYEGQHYLVMEYVDGGSLDARMRGKPLPPKKAAALVAVLAKAVQAAHDKGIIHRDIKPSNVMLTAQGLPKLADFGLAKRLDERTSATATGTILGTPSYMAPEQAQANKVPVSFATDVYGLGALLYDVLTGRPPFRADSFLDTVMEVVYKSPTPPRQYRPDISAELEAICLHCLAKDPTERFPSAGALADALVQCIGRMDLPSPAATTAPPAVPMNAESDSAIIDLATVPRQGSSVIVPRQATVRDAQPRRVAAVLLGLAALAAGSLAALGLSAPGLAALGVATAIAAAAIGLTVAVGHVLLDRELWYTGAGAAWGWLLGLAMLPFTGKSLIRPETWLNLAELYPVALMTLGPTLALGLAAGFLASAFSVD